ncbi:MAG: hypothetical protein K0R24_411 [Gammaproteobacteria bacterium]|jgi:heme exporter protein CcmD|nr:hypothetical protein [Gammaproteobacteria bacterium]
MGQEGHTIMIMDMGVYNIYIWPAYGITLLVFIINIVSALYKKYQTKKRIKRKLR